MSTGLTIVRVPVAVGTEGNRILKSVGPSLGKLLFVVNLQIGLVIRLFLEGRGLFALLEAANHHIHQHVATIPPFV